MIGLTQQPTHLDINPVDRDARLRSDRAQHGLTVKEIIQGNRSTA